MDSTPAGLNTKTRLIRLPAMNMSGMWAHPTSLGFVGGVHLFWKGLSHR